MARKDIRPSDTIHVCDVCGRTLLRGERSDHYIHSGERKLVCELCRGRAVNEGWIPEDESLGPRAGWGGSDRRRSFLARFRANKRGAGDPLVREPAADAPPASLNGDDDFYDDEGLYEDEPAAAAPPPPPPPAPPPPRREREPESAPVAHERHVHAVPSSIEMKHSRALELFNISDHPRTVAGIARSLGPPLVAVQADPVRPSVVTIAVAWELSWYRYELDLTDEAGGVRVAAQGQELEELEDSEQVANAVADEKGLLALPSP
jgi:hypothetical protein